MNAKNYTLILGTIVLITSNLFGQVNENCFLYDYKPDTAVIPASVDAQIPADKPTVIVTLESDTIGEISRYVFGNAIAAWAGAHDNPTLVEGVKKLAPTLIRFPGGSWSDGYFWNGLPSDLPDSIYDGTTYNSTTGTATKAKFYGQTGKGGWQTTPDQYYTLRSKTNVAQGLITINYAYARYGTSADPVAKAAHLAADWVRYDAGRTKFWEIGNENGGPWEYGWIIDTTLNQDGQPRIITGELYGKHFKVFADSMRKAAAELGDTIYIGGQIVVDGEASWNFVDHTWNAGFFNEVGDSSDFYVIHNYFSNSTDVNGALTSAQMTVKQNMKSVQQDIINKSAYPKPVALTEYNMNSGNLNESVSYVDGMQAVVLICELINNNFGLGARWLITSGDGGMFYGGSDANYLNHPHADFYYLNYLQNFCGDHAISTASTNTDILCYASKFATGETGMVIVNKGNKQKVISVSTDSVGVGNKYYLYSFTSDKDSGDFSPNVYINGTGPDQYQWGPYDELTNIKANAYTIDGEIKFTSPGRSVQMIMIEGGNNHLTVNDSVLISGVNPAISNSFELYQNSPNPVNSSTIISYQLPASVFVSLKVFDFQGREIKTLINERQRAGNHVVHFNVSDLQNGVYFYRINAGKNYDTKKLIVLK